MSSYNVKNCHRDKYEILIPANAFEQDVVTFRAVLDASQQTHGCVSTNGVVELHRIQILDRDPPENGSIHDGEYKKKRDE